MQRERLFNSIINRGLPISLLGGVAIGTLLDLNYVINNISHFSVGDYLLNSLPYVGLAAFARVADRLSTNYFINGYIKAGVVPREELYKMESGPNYSKTLSVRYTEKKPGRAMVRDVMSNVALLGITSILPGVGLGYFAAMPFVVANNVHVGREARKGWVPR